MNNKTEIYGFGFDFWVFSVLQKYDENAFPQVDGLHYRAVPYKEENSFAFPLCEEDGAFYNETTSKDECGSVLFIQEKSKDCGYFNVS